MVTKWSVEAWSLTNLGKSSGTDRLGWAGCSRPTLHPESGEPNGHIVVQKVECEQMGRRSFCSINDTICVNFFQLFFLIYVIRIYTTWSPANLESFPWNSREGNLDCALFICLNWFGTQETALHPFMKQMKLTWTKWRPQKTPHVVARTHVWMCPRTGLRPYLGFHFPCICSIWCKNRPVMG